MTGPEEFRFLNLSRRVHAEQWRADATSELWQYNLHYFDDLNAVDAATRGSWHVQAIADWIRCNPPSIGIGWAPYPTSLRVVNWIKWALGGAQPDEAMVESLALQVRWLRQHLEYHLLGNHLFANAKALVFAGLFFEGHEASGWLEQGMKILERQIPEQILEDGGQFERSTMYHALAFEDILDLINAFNAFHGAASAHWTTYLSSLRPLARSMASWLTAMSHPDGEIAFFNDAAIGVAPSPGELERYARAVLGDSEGPPAASVRHLRATGYVRADFPDAAIFVDVAPVGPDYLPGHAHADTLSFELSLFGDRLIVNGGTSCYGKGPERQRERGTAAHSTVTVNEENSSEVWSGFRVARRARPFDLAIKRASERVTISCSHDGYRRLPGSPVHHRAWVFDSRRLRIDDKIYGRPESAIARYHLHPQVECAMDDNGSSGRLRTLRGKDVAWRAFGGSTSISESVYCPEFGRRERTKCLELRLGPDMNAGLELTW